MQFGPVVCWIGAAPTNIGVSKAMDDLQDRSRAKEIQIGVELGRLKVEKRKRIALPGSSCGGV